MLSLIERRPSVTQPAEGTTRSHIGITDALISILDFPGTCCLQDFLVRILSRVLLVGRGQSWINVRTCTCQRECWCTD